MRRLGFHILIVFVALNQICAQKSDYDAIVRRYIEKYKGVAINEMKVYAIPASITLAQGILESNAGRSDLATLANNHFGIKCHKEWTGPTFIKDDETRNECFRKYTDPLESFRDHSQFLTTRDRYKGLFNLEMTDYKGWANGLKAAGYATNPAYPQLLIKTIETFSLSQYDEKKAAIANNTRTEMKTAPQNPGRLPYMVLRTGPGSRVVYENNHIPMVISSSDDNIYSISGDFNISVEKLLKYNDLSDPASMVPGQIVYLDGKHRKGSKDFHSYQDGETLYAISQLYGMKLKMIYKRNGLRTGNEPAAGTILRLR
jgi:LysM repeat protein